MLLIARVRPTSCLSPTALGEDDRLAPPGAAYAFGGGRNQLTSSPSGRPGETLATMKKETNHRAGHLWEYHAEEGALGGIPTRDTTPRCQPRGRAPAARVRRQSLRGYVRRAEHHRPGDDAIRAGAIRRPAEPVRQDHLHRASRLVANPRNCSAWKTNWPDGSRPCTSSRPRTRSSPTTTMPSFSSTWSMSCAASSTGGEGPPRRTAGSRRHHLVAEVTLDDVESVKKDIELNTRRPKRRAKVGRVLVQHWPAGQAQIDDQLLGSNHTPSRDPTEAPARPASELIHRFNLLLSQCPHGR